MKELTRAEEQIMQILWRIGKGHVNDLLEYFPEPKPAYNTVSTIIRILEKKEFVDHEAIGKSHRYFPKVSKREYARFTMKQMLNGYFSNSYKQMVSFFTREHDLSLKEMEEIRQLIEQQIHQKKQLP
ncbi:MULTISPECIES: BlaI/MecI/CopY family transcriptional regulator [Lentimicrobium]|jgi:predicted transcriptional regulator|uniref:Predicted transcriptional regulator n=2 Tax=Lentimicrobium TaxID=1840214 RepID=A0A0S7C4T4_9BACT|nr:MULTISPECIES: BlaI/MecI/CopY family transcriptional regulator [Lentimicrobium]MCO5263331.1 BlaI/MecI/CopY family transcriptional regulator [Lentimicrobium sp.]GAP43823.1 predicted transcriptional regulator [Lentimicrobium saccharophilum]HPF66010.1 BlaI/MecI/CopY family transcriptional regulator [Lentimicrobium sp.]HPJ63592.1 BlaI/MecI/CopY family transcriptional regulator [Lentimicrobium sp.]HPR27565.1 BlaI/MecI/CopY family transcriptional regulator [Lentimicrobium sp.]